MVRLSVVAVRVRVRVRATSKLTVRIKVRVRREILMCPIRGSNSATVFVASRRFCQTNSAQALKRG